MRRACRRLRQRNQWNTHFILVLILKKSNDPLLGSHLLVKAGNASIKIPVRGGKTMVAEMLIGGRLPKLDEWMNAPIVNKGTAVIRTIAKRGFLNDQTISAEDGNDMPLLFTCRGSLVVNINIFLIVPTEKVSKSVIFLLDPNKQHQDPSQLYYKICINSDAKHTMKTLRFQRIGCSLHKQRSAMITCEQFISWLARAWQN